MKTYFLNALKNKMDIRQENTVEVGNKRIFDRSLLTVTTSLGSINFMTLVIPILMESIFNNLIGTVSTAVLSGYSEEAVAATGTVNIVFTLFAIFFSSIATGTSVVISNLIGADQIKKAERVSFTAITMIVMLALVCSGIMFILSRSLVGWLQLTGTVYELALVYFRIRISGFILMGTSSVILAVMRCYGFPKSSVITGVITNICNVLFSIYAVYFAEIPFLSGVSGVATGCVLSQCIGLGIGIFMLCRAKIRIRRAESIKELWQIFGRILVIGIPACISGGSFTLSQLITNSFAVMLGLHAVLGKVYFSTILSYAYLFSISMGNANSLLIGRLYGAGRYEHARRLNRMLVRITIPLNLLVSVLIILMRKPLLSLFTDNSLIIQMSLGILLVDIVTEQARAVSHVHEHALRASGDVTPTMIVTLISCWVFSVGLAYFLSIYCGLGLIGCWIGLAIDESIRAVYTYYRWRTGKWCKNK